MKYSIWTTLLKFALGAIGGTIYAPLVQWLLDGLQNNNWAMNPDAQALTITLISAAAAGLYAAGKNWWNNYAMPRMARIKFVKMLAIGGACGVLIGAQGCMTAGTGTPLAFGKPAKMSTEIKTQMPPEVDPVSGALVPGESYCAKIEKELPAGTDLEGQDNLHFGIGVGGDWDITLGQAAGYSSHGQAQGLLEFSKVNAQLQRDQQAQAWGSIMPFLSLVAPEAADQAGVAAFILAGAPRRIVAHPRRASDRKVGTHAVDQPDETVVEDINLVHTRRSRLLISRSRYQRAFCRSSRRSPFRPARAMY